MPAQPLPAQVGRLAVHGDALAEPLGTIAQPLMQAAIEGDLVRRLVDNRGNRAAARWGWRETD